MGGWDGRLSSESGRLSSESQLLGKRRSRGGPVEVGGAGIPGFCLSHGQLLERLAERRGGRQLLRGVDFWNGPGSGFRV